MGAVIYHRPSILKQIRRGNHAVIEASAGTGKTFVIEHLVVDLLLSGECKIDEILVVTFTEKATAELRLRVRQALQNIVFEEPAAQPAGDCEAVVIDAAAHRRLRDAFYSFERAPIFTIHGFCHRVLTDLAFHSGTLLDLQLTDGRGAFHKAFRAELREHLAADAVTGPLLERWLNGTLPHQDKGLTADDLEKLLFGAYLRRYQNSTDSDRRARAAQRLLDRYDARFFKQAFQRSGLKGQTLSKALDRIDELSGCIAEAGGSAQSLLESLAQFAPEPITRPVLKPYKYESGVKFPPRAREIAEALHEAAAIAKSYEWKLVDLFLPAVRERLQKQKREQGLIDYDDMLAWVADALDGTGGPALAAALRQRFRCALVDEFQDTDDLQWRIFRRLFADTNSNRLYVVGDPKQAIYAFRGADVFTYLKARGELTTRANPPVQLLDNFRSTADLIKACNHIFDQNAPEPLFEPRASAEENITYDHPVRCGRPDRRTADLAGNPITPVILMRYQSADGEASFSEVRRAIGQHIAAELRRILREDAHRIRIEDRDRRAEPVKAGGIFVLTRTRQESAEIGDYLREADVPFAFYKQEGLFQTAEAYHVLDVLRAVAQPHIRSNRLKAWVTPFFAIPLREIALIEEVPPMHPLNERLYEWKAIAEQQRFADLFECLLHDSGLAARELFLAGSERQITNYQHIFEVLLAAATSHRLALPEIIALLEDYIFERATPEVENPNIQRLESERDAVSVITVHMSKGLEADVVALFGGFGAVQDRETIFVYHENKERRFAIGKAAKGLIEKPLKEEAADEDSRLLYVALTRARARVYLPMLPPGSTKREVYGYYAALNHRLLEIEANLSDPSISKLFAVQNVAQPHETGADAAGLAARLGAWAPPPQFVDDKKDTAHAGSLWNLRRERAPMVMRSYTSLRGAQEQERWDIPPEDFKEDIETPSGEDDLPGGREVGIFLHQVIEKMPMDSFVQPPDVNRWRAREDVKALFYAAMRRNQVKNQPAWFERGTQIVFNALTLPIEIAPGRAVGPLHRGTNVREMELVYPIPEPTHPLLAAAAAQGEWTVERGYWKGVVDFVFEHGGLFYFADWKSDRLGSYEAAEMQHHVKNHYFLQAQIYSIGVVRLLQIRNEHDYECRFGGLLYVFLRGLDGSGRGVYFHRPQWSEICSYEAELMRMGAGPAA